MSHINRKKEIAVNALPPKGTDAYKKVISYLEKSETPESVEFKKKNWEKVIASLEAQNSSSSGLLTEKNLRHFLTEFNNRAWKSGLWSMPTMFNVMESFFNYKKPEVYFELIEEENYYVSLLNFLDFVTSDEFIMDKNILEDNISENIIYNFEVNKHSENLTFKNSNGHIFLMRGVSLIRRDNEITLSIIAGKKKDKDDKLNTDIYQELENDNPNKEKIVQQIKEDLKNKNLEFEYLDEQKKYIKTIIRVRLDIETLTVDTTYVGVETNMMFDITTDDKTIFVDRTGKFPTDLHEKSHLDNVDRIRKYDAIFDLVNYLVYLPYYFNIKESDIRVEDIDTDYKKLIQNPLKKRKFQNTLGYKTSIKSIFYLDENNILSPDKIILRDDLFRVEKSGFWKKLSPDEIGMDKKGSTIHGRTWVNQSMTWFEAKEDDLTIEEEKPVFEGPNVGYIYILRNPIMGKNIFKIGLTRNDVDYRVDQLSKTSVPDKFYKVQEWLVKDCVAAERKIHEILNDYRVDPRREFFEIDYSKALEVITSTVKQINE